MRYLFLAAIGPVQDFIASARRSRDLWFGSWLLSELSKAAAQAIAQQPDATLIFPAPLSPADLDPESEFNVANKLLAILPDTPGNLPDTVKTAIDARLASIARDAFKKFDGRDWDRDRAWAQVRDLVEYYWAAVPLQSDEDYAEARARGEALLAARKVTRNFRPSSWGAPIPKSSLDGQHESVIPKEAYNVLNQRELFEQYGIRRGEQLDGVGLLKRHGNSKVQRFFSTSHVAALPLIESLPASAAVAVETYVQALRDLGVSEVGRVPGPVHPVFKNYDGHLLFEERLAEFLDGPALTDARELLHAFLKNQLGDRQPGPYYALLRADGDRMGKAIDNIADWRQHQRLSQTLARFAVGVRRTVEQYHGSLVYSGGDDVLAFLPLHMALKCAAALASDFAAQLQGFRTADGQTPTLSAGIAVTHHLEPLGDALDLAAKAERTAKGTRNALAITVSKRSGADRTVGGPWGSFNVRLDKFVTLHRLDAVPDGAAYELRTLARQLGGDKKATRNPLLAEAMSAEAIRILERKQPNHGAKRRLAGAALKTLAAALAALQQEAAELDRAGAEVGDLADELIVARLFADAEDLAQMPVRGLPEEEDAA